MSQYPETVIEVLQTNKRYKPAALRAVRALARAKPWTGCVEERIQKFKTLNSALAVAYSIPEPTFRFGLLDDSHSGASFYSRRQHRIVLTGKLSVVTYLHEFGHARGMDERTACCWSINLFRRCFPRQYAKLAHEGHMLIRRGRTSGRALSANQYNCDPKPRQ